MGVIIAPSIAASTPPVVWPAGIEGGEAGEERREVHEGEEE